MNRSTLWRVVVGLSSLSLLSCPHHPPPPGPGPTPTPPPTPLTGFVDLHTHPMANLGFAGKLLYGGPDYSGDGGALLPSDPDCNNDVRALTVQQALGHDRSTHGDWALDNMCGDSIRSLVISAVQTMNNANNPPSDALGALPFSQWPMSNDVTHQVMWAESIKRAWQAGLRVMVALAVNNTTLADTVAGLGDGPDDDMSSADLQIAELKAMVARHSDFMEVAYDSDDLQRIVAGGKLAIVLGLEVDNIGDFNTYGHLTQADIANEIARLHDEGVRYLFPIHLIDNPFGSTAAYQDLFNLSNLREAGHFWNLQCADPADQINYRLTMTNPLLDPFSDPLTAEMAALMVFKLHLISFDNPAPPPCPGDGGVLNRGTPTPGLTPDGVFAVQEMMRQCMLIDVDHASQASRLDLVALALDAGYPMNSGHNNVRSARGGQTERQLVPAQYAQLQQVHGLFGVGSARQNEADWLIEAQDVLNAAGDGGVVGFGTDSDGISPLMPPPPFGAPPVVYSSSYPASTLGGASWDYNDAGVAHYGMLSDFLKGLTQLDGGAALFANMMQGAQAFHDSWARAESFCGGPDAGSGPHHHLALVAAPNGQCPDGTVMRPACHRCLRPRESCPVCDADAGTDGCLARPPCPPDHPRNRWGVCSARPLADALEAPLVTKLAPASTRGATFKPGKYVVTLTAHDGKKAAFSFELKGGAGKPWTIAGKTAKAPASAGFIKDLWAMEWVTGPKLVMLVGRPGKDGAPEGGFVVHQPGAATVSGSFRLAPQSPDTLKGAEPFDKLGAFVGALR
jgi:microsomal dipeptidase-like Zn-dependent dipeptidase